MCVWGGERECTEEEEGVGKGTKIAQLKRMHRRIQMSLIILSQLKQ